MTLDVRELYREAILDHNRKPRNFHKLEGANQTAEGYNPLCGDKVRVYLKIENDRVNDVSFEGSGCSISTASGAIPSAATSRAKPTVKVSIAPLLAA